MQAWQREITLRSPVPGTGGRAFAPGGTAVRATLQPMSAEAAARMYGLEHNELWLMLYPEGATVERGMGACVNVAASADPDFRVLSAQRWHTHGVAHLQFIPPEERGAEE